MTAARDRTPSARTCRPELHHVIVVRTRSWRHPFRRRTRIVCPACGLEVFEP